MSFRSHTMTKVAVARTLNAEARIADSDEAGHPFRSEVGQVMAFRRVEKMLFLHLRQQRQPGAEDRKARTPDWPATAVQPARQKRCEPIVRFRRVPEEIKLSSASFCSA